MTRPDLTAPRARGDGPAGAHPPGRHGGCSPRTRGWTLRIRGLRRRAGLLPAHAGVAVPAPRGISEVRDSKRPQGPVLVFRASAWSAFVNELKANLPT